MFHSFYRGKKVFITGHTGFKGAWLTQWLLDLGAEVVGFSNDFKTEPSLFDLLNLKDQIVDLRGDVRNENALANALNRARPEVVFHLAAQALVRSSYDDPVTTFSTNVMGTVHLLEAVRKTASVRGTVVVTSDKCYANHETGSRFDESSPLGGSDPYSASKACAEMAVASYYRSFFAGGTSQVISVRAGNAIGGGDWAAHRLVPDCIRSLQGQSEVVIRNPHSIRPWQHVLDPLGGYLKAAAALCSPGSTLCGEAFNFGPDADQTLSVELFASQLRRAWFQGHGRNSPESLGSGSFLFLETETAKKEAAQLFLNSDKAKNLLQWRPVFSVEKAIDLTAQWYRHFYDRKQNPIDLTRSQIQEYQRNLAPRGAP